jgi:hypothetical protein
MSWKDDIITDFIIRTGDGKTFGGPNASTGITFAWKNAKYTIGYNIAEFEFINVAGTLVNRRQPKGRKFNFEIWFQGATCISDADTFRISANDPRPWTITHPFYGNIQVQPGALSFDNCQYNVTEVKGILNETLGKAGPAPASTTPAQQVAAAASTAASTLQSAAHNIATQVFNGKHPPAEQDYVKSLNQFQTFIAITNKIISQTRQYVVSADAYAIGAEAQAQTYINLLNQTTAAIVNLATAPLTAISTLQTLIMQPARFIQSTQSRISSLTASYAAAETSILNTGKILSQIDKLFMELIGGSIACAICSSAVSPIAGDYGSADDVLAVINTITAYYSQYLADLDSIQTATGGEESSYVPDHDSLFALNTVINLSTSQLYQIALNSKQKRSFVLEADSNWINLTQRLYGMDDTDSNLTKLIAQNGAGLSESLIVKKNRVVVYYV